MRTRRRRGIWVGCLWPRAFVERRDHGESVMRRDTNMEKPLPRITGVDRSFWEAADAGQMKVQRCQSSSCGHFILYPRVCCPYCGGGELSWEKVSVQGTIRTYPFVHRQQHQRSEERGVGKGCVSPCRSR